MEKEEESQGKIYMEVAALIFSVEFFNELAFHFPDKDDINKDS